MADEIKLKITLESGEVVDGFLNIEKKAKDTSKKIESGFEKAGGAFTEGFRQAAPDFSSKIESIASTATKLLSNPFVAVGLAVAVAGVAGRHG